jgi:hypothetical protein
MTDRLALFLDRSDRGRRLAALLHWRPAHGVVSLYVDADPADRGGRWRIELRDGLHRAAEAAANGPDRETRLAVEATVRRIEALLSEGGEAVGRGLIGFVEASREPADEQWFASQLPPHRTDACYAPAPQVGPLIALLDDGAPLGIVAASAERLRLFDWRLGRIEQLHDWELEVGSLDWRERKAPRSRDRAAPRMVTAAGSDQHDQRLEANRERFARQAGALTQAEARKLAWRQVLAFGDERYVSHFADGLGGGYELRHVDSSDLVPQPTHLISDRIEGLLPALNRDRECALIERVKEVAFTEARSALGAQETLQALEEGRVEHLVYDAGRTENEIERMIELAVATGAAITPVEEESAAMLAEQGGVAALLRY